MLYSAPLIRRFSLKFFSGVVMKKIRVQGIFVHRKNIRKKLGIAGKRTNLRTHLLIHADQFLVSLPNTW